MADELETVEVDNGNQREQQSPGLTRLLWAFFSEMKTAIVLLLVLALASVLGTVIKQNASPEEYVQLYGSVGSSLITYFGLSDVYDSTIYRFILSLVGISLTVCSINRLGITWRRAFQPKVDASAKSIGSMQRSETLTTAKSVDAAADIVTGSLKGKSYRVTRESSGKDVVLFAARGVTGLWGPYLTHLSLLVIFVGAIYGNITGFNGFTAINEGSATTAYFEEGAQMPSELGFQVALRKFEVTYDAANNPTGYKSDLAVYEGDELVKEKVIDVNHPLTYKGITFFQSSYGLGGILVRITAPDGESQEVVMNAGSGMDSGHGGEAFQQVEIGGKTLTLFIHDMAQGHGGMQGASGAPNEGVQLLVNDRLPEYKGLDAWERLEWLGPGQSTPYNGYTITMDRVVNYTGLQVSKNPGLPVIYLGFGLLLAGVVLSFYVPYRVIRLRLTSTDRGASVAVGASSRDDQSVFDRDFDRIRGALSE